MKNAKRFWALFLALAMTLAMFPATVFANGDEGAEGTEYVATFDANGGYFEYGEGNPVNELKVTADEYGYVDFPYECYRQAHNFIGWSLSKNGQDVIDDWPYEITENTILYAQWERYGYVLSFDAGEGGYFPDEEGNPQISNTTFDFEDGWIYCPTPKKEGYYFSHWKNAQGKRVEFYGEEDSLIYQPTKDETFTAVWEKATKLILKANKSGNNYAFNDNGNTTYEIVLWVMPNETIGGIESYISSDGKKRVSGWVDENGKAIDEYEYVVGTSDVTLYAQWEDILNLTINAGDGVFNPDDEGDGDTTREETLRIGDSLSTYATKTTDNKKVWRAWNPYNYPTPKSSNKAFEGWYTNSACTQVLEQEEVTEEFIEANDGALNLYAKYTSNCRPLTIHGNGGYFFSENDITELTTKYPTGAALDLNACWLDNDDSDSTQVVRAWCSDKDMTQRVYPNKDGYYILPDGVTDLYPVWGDEINADLSLSGDYSDFYADGDYEVSADLKVNEEKTPLSDFDYTCSLQAKDGDTDRIVEFDNTNGEYFTTDGGSIILHGEAIRDELNYNRSTLTLTVKVSDEYGNAICEDAIEITLLDPYDVYFDFDKGLSDADELMIVGESRWFEKESDGKSYNNADPEGIGFVFNILSVTSSDESVISVQEDDYGYLLSAKKAGNSNITVKYTDINGKPKTDTFEFEVDESRYRIELDQEVATCIIGKPYRVKAKGIRSTLNPNFDWDTDDEDDMYIDHTDGFEYRWSANMDTIHIEEVEGQPGTVDIIADEYLSAEDDYVAMLTVELWANGKCKARAEMELYPREYYYEIEKVPDLDEYMRIGKSVKITPELRYYHKDPTDTEDYDVIKNTRFRITFNSKVFTVKNSKGTKMKSEDFFTGSCTIERIGDAKGDIEITVENEDGDEYAWRSLLVDRIYNISKAKIAKIAATRVYSGKAFTPNPKLTYNFYGYYEEIYKNHDYTVAYKNNKNVGTATITFTGKGCLYGSVKKTFKINPKGTALKKVKAGKKSFTATWKKQATQTTGYQIQYGLKKNFKGAKTVTVKKNKTVKYTVKKLKAKKKYYVRIRTYKQIGKTKYYSAWSKAKTVKTK